MKNLFIFQFYYKRSINIKLNEPFLSQVLHCEENLHEYHEGSKIALSQARLQSFQSRVDLLSPLALKTFQGRLVVLEIVSLKK